MSPPPLRAPAKSRSERLGLRALLCRDLERFAETYRLRGQRYTRAKVLFESLLFKPGFQAVILYRLSHWLFQHGLVYPAWSVARLNQFLTGAEIEFNARIGPGLFIAHPGGIVVGRGTCLGQRTTLFQNVTFGARSWHPADIRGFPLAGDNCFFGAGAVVLGHVRLGDDCVVAANAVVSEDMPDGALARGVPAQVIPARGRRLLQTWGLLAAEAPVAPRQGPAGRPALAHQPASHEVIVGR